MFYTEKKYYIKIEKSMDLILGEAKMTGPKPLKMFPVSFLELNSVIDYLTNQRANLVCSDSVKD